MELGEKIQLARKKKAMSQEDLANLLNVSRQAVQKWESGATQPEIGKLVQISNMLDVSLDYLLKDIKEETKVENKNGEEVIIKEEKKRRLNKDKFTSIKIWLIVGCVLSPLALGGSMLNTLGAFSYLALIWYALNIPLCVITIRKLKEARSRDDFSTLAVINLVFVSFIGGILMLTIKDVDFVEFDEIEEVIEKPKKSKFKQIFTTEKTITEKKSKEEPIKEEVKTEAKSKEDLEEVKTEEKQNEEIVDEIILDVDGINYREKTQEYLSKEKVVIDLCKEKRIKDKLELKYSEFEKECKNITTKKQYEDFKTKVGKSFSYIKRFYSKKTLGFMITSIVLVVFITASAITSGVIILNQKAAAQRAEDYKELTYLISRYENNYVSGNYDLDSEIEHYLRKLDGYYDLSEYRTEYKNVYNYCRLKGVIGAYSGTTEENDNINRYLGIIDNGYKKRNDIENDFKKAKYYCPLLYMGSSNIEKNASDEKASSNRDLIMYMYRYANTSGLWDYNNLISKIEIPYLTYGIKFAYSNYYFKDSYVDEDTGRRLYDNIPTPSSYKDSEEYYFSNYFDSSTNSFTYYLAQKSNTKIRFEFFKINSIKYLSNTTQFACSVYIYGNGLTWTFKSTN